MASKDIDKVDITDKELLVATRQLEISLNSGISILDALNFISDQGPSEKMKALFANMSAHINKGNSFSSALKSCSNSFSRLYINMVIGAEKSGTLAETLSKLADHQEKQDDMKKKIKTYLTYPCIIFVVSIGTLFFVTLFVLPSFVKSLNVPFDRLPLITQLLLSFSTFLTGYWYLGLAALAGAGWYGRRILKSVGTNPAVDAAILKLPLMGGLMQKIYISRFVASLGTLLDKGVPILDALNVARDVSGNSVIAAEIDKIYENVKVGLGLSEKIRSSPYFPPLVANMVATGEMSGRLPAALQKVSEFYDKDVDAALRDFFASLEPILILGMGIVVGVIVAGMMLPVLNMSEMV